ncbi:MAG: hypothetical protein H0W83_12155, partial [Planctomycetes bacterium]|nr:hypothetical protein [Planctomycetota bacterium]
LFAQDLYRWHGKLAYGFWQYRFGQAHRNDRWDCDYGRWGWSLNDGAGRIGQALMQEFLRTLDRRYFAAGDAFGRICYDTALVHTHEHLESAKGWWTAIGCSHRHNVQPFGCPYIGLRGSHPTGQRILFLLTGDGVIKDGLELVAATALAYAQGQDRRLGASSGSDGQGAAACALLWKYETTGDTIYRDACRKVLDQSGLIPTTDLKALAYGPDFGLIEAAAEYAALSRDDAFRDRVVALARTCASAEHPRDFLGIIAVGTWLSRDDALSAQVAKVLKKMATETDEGLEDQPAASWPGHGGWKTPAFNANHSRDLPFAMAVVTDQSNRLDWPAPIAATRTIPADAPRTWYRPGGAQTAAETVPTASALFADTSATGGTEITIGDAVWRVGDHLIDRVVAHGAKPLAAPIVAYVAYAAATAVDTTVAKVAVVEAASWRIGAVGDAAIGVADAAGTRCAVRVFRGSVDGVPSLRLEIACRPPATADRIAHWGLRIPCIIGPDAHAVQTTAPGRFRLERCRLDQNDERLPNWLTSVYGWGEGATQWPRWRESGIEIGPGDSYRIWRANRRDVSPTVCDQGDGTGNWLDVTDRGVSPRWGLTTRVLRIDRSMRSAIRIDLESGVMDIQFHSASAPPLSTAAVRDGVSAAVDLILHDGYRPPLSKPDLTALQYEAFIDDLHHDEQYGLAALRFALSITHQVDGREWMERIRDLGIEPREILYQMRFGDGLAGHCAKIGVRWDAADVEGSITRVLDHYRTSAP